MNFFKIILIIIIIYSCGATKNQRSYEYFRDMAPTGDEKGGVTYEAFDTNKIFKNEQTSQNPIKNTIPRGHKKEPFEPVGTPIYENYNPDEVINKSGIYVLTPKDVAKSAKEAKKAGLTLKNPLPPTPENIARGKKLHNTFCNPCHGLGKKKELGPLASYKGFTTVQSLKSYPYEEGRFYYAITAGRNAMPSYASQISSDDRWKIIHYIIYELQKRPKKVQK